MGRSHHAALGSATKRQHSFHPLVVGLGPELLSVPLNLESGERQQDAEGIAGSIVSAADRVRLAMSY